MFNHELDHAIAAIARRQCGVFSHEQVLVAGGSDRMIALRVQAGVWIRLESSVFCLTSARPDFRRQCWAAVLGNPGSGIGAFSAGSLLNFDTIRPGKVEIVVGPKGNARSSLARIHRYDGPRFTSVGGLRVTTRAQTIFDLAPRLDFDRLERIIDSELLTGRLQLGELEERQAFYDGARRAGLPVMRGLISERGADGWQPPASELERRADRVLARLSGHPRIVREAAFPWLQRGHGRVDRHLPDDGIVVEIDGRRWHARLRDFDKDRWRDNLMVSHGLLPLRFTYTHLVTRPNDVLAVVEATRRLRNAA